MTVDVTHACSVLLITIDNTTVCEIGYEPAGLTVHPPPPRMFEGGFIFFAWVFSATKIFPEKKVEFVGDIRIGTHQTL